MNPGAGIGLAALACGWALAAGAWSAPDGGDVTAVKVTAGPARSAQRGAVKTAATSGPLAIGAIVRDPAGVPIGHVTRLTTDRAGDSVAEVREGEDIYSIPVADLSMSGGEALSTIAAADLKSERETAAH